MLTTKNITISAPLIHHSMTGAILAGVDIQRLLSKSGISRQQLEDPQGRLSVEKVVKLQRYCNGAMSDEVNGLLHKPMRLGSFRLMALSTVHARTLGEAMQRYIQFYNLFENSFHYSLIINRRHTELILQPLPDQQVKDQYIISSIMAVIHRFIGWLGNEHIILNQVKLAMEAPDYIDEFRYMFYGAPVLLNQHCHSLSFDSSYLQHLIVQTEASVESYVRRAPMDLYLPINASGKWTVLVRKTLKSLVATHQNLPQLEELCATLNINPQTLRRRLKQEGSSFDNIKVQIRRDIAIHYLGEGSMTMAAIAEQCGYTEPSAFIRAFKTWTGFTPLQFKKGLKTG